MWYPLILLLFCVNSHALSLYEVGVAAGVGYVPNYPASDEGKVRTLIVPNFRFRGKHFKVDDKNGARAGLWNYKSFSLDLSFGASFPVNSNDSATRKEMRPLNWLAEFGPRLQSVLWHDPGVGRLRLTLPFRSVFSTDVKNYTYVGTVLVPGIVAEKYAWPCESCRTVMTLGSTIASRGVGNYFYEVNPRDVNEWRSEYHATGGYLGSDLTAGVTYVKDAFSVFVGARASSYKGAANDNSPLFKATENFGGFIGIGWLFYQSKAQTTED
jgi:outer membrane protein